MAATKHTEKHLLTDTVPKAASALTSHRFANYQGATCVDAEKAFGVFRDDCNIGDTPAVHCEGIAIVESAVAFSKGDPLTSDAQGRARVAATGEAINGYALAAATGVGELIPVHLK